MSRIVALVHRDGRPVDREILARLARPMRIAAANGPRLWVEGNAGLAYQCFRNSEAPDELQPGEAGHDLAVSFDGRLDNREELAGLLALEETANPAILPDWAMALASYHRFGDAFAARMKGDFAVALLDRRHQKLVLARDAIGVRPLYYVQVGQIFAAASEIKALLAHPCVEAQPDDNALADLLAGGAPDELHLTLFRNVRRVLPSHTVVVNREGIREFEHWDFDPTRQLRYGSLSDYAEAFRGLFAQSVRRRLRKSESVAVAVSGGLDSSAILCQAELLGRAGATIPSVHGISRLFPEGSQADERQYLVAIEAQYGIGIHKLPAAPIATTGDGNWPWRIECPELPGSSDLDYRAAARELGCTTVLDGQYGDQVLWSAAPFYDSIRAFRWREARERFRALCASMAECEPGQLRMEIARELVRDLIPDRTLVAWRRWRGWLGAGRAPGWISRQFQVLASRETRMRPRPSGPLVERHARLCYGAVRNPQVPIRLEIRNKIAAHHGLEQAHPFLDSDLIAFLMAIPGEVVLWKGVYKGLFREAMRGVLPEAIRTRDWKADFTRLESDAAIALRSGPFGMSLGPRALCVERGYVDASALDVARSCSGSEADGGDYVASKQLNELVSLDLWLRAFFPATALTQ